MNKMLTRTLKNIEFQSTRLNDDTVKLNLFKYVKDFTMDHIDVRMDRMISKIKKELDVTEKMKTRMEKLSIVIMASEAAMYIAHSNASLRLKEIHNKLCVHSVLFNEKFLLEELSKTLVVSS